MIVCVADATNLRLVLRLVLELKRVGRPMVLALNMFDIARKRRASRSTSTRLSRELGVPVVTTVAVRSGGIDELLAEVDSAVASRAASPAPPTGTSPTPASCAAASARPSGSCSAVVRRAGAAATPCTGRVDAVLLHPVAGLVILLAILFLMFQAVFTWAHAGMDVIEAGFAWLGELVETAPLPDLLKSFLVDGADRAASAACWSSCRRS